MPRKSIVIKVLTLYKRPFNVLDERERPEAMNSKPRGTSNLARDLPHDLTSLIATSTGAVYLPVEVNVNTLDCRGKHDLPRVLLVSIMMYSLAKAPQSIDGLFRPAERIWTYLGNFETNILIGTVKELFFDGTQVGPSL